MLSSKAVECCAVLSNKARYAILRALVDAGREGLSLRGLSLELEISRATVKRHIGHLSKAGLVDTERQNRAVICRANMETLSDFLNALRRSFDTDWGAKQNIPKQADVSPKSLRDRLKKIDSQENFSDLT
ncbi:MAG: ArsR/SmtB family transcription factor [Methyloligellaceae bacterium]